MGLFSIFLFAFNINCVTTGARNKPIEHMFCFICSEQSIKIISLRKMCGLIYNSVFKKITPYNTTHNFQAVGGRFSFFDFRDSISEVSVIFQIQFQK